MIQSYFRRQIQNSEKFIMFLGRFNSRRLFFTFLWFHSFHFHKFIHSSIMGGGKIVAVNGKRDWDTYLSLGRSQKKLIVVDFTAKWCGPCRTIAPHFEKLSEIYSNALFLKVDIDENEELAMEYGIRSIPAFHFFVGGNKVDEMLGADQGKLESLIKKHYTNPTFQGQGQTLRSSGSGSSNSNSNYESRSNVWNGFDESLPTTSIQIRLPDGKPVVGKFNLFQTIADIRSFVKTSVPNLPSKYSLVCSFPAKTLSDDSITIQDAGLANSAISIRI